MDKLTICPMTGKVAYELELGPDLKMFMSLGNGFWTNSLMTEDNEFYLTQIETLPEIYKEIAWTDPTTNLIWIPSFVQEQGKGMVYVINKGLNDWVWEGIKHIPVSEDEKTRFPDITKPGTYLQYKVDVSSKMQFEQDAFVDALKYIGVDFNL